MCRAYWWSRKSFSPLVEQTRLFTQSASSCSRNVGSTLDIDTELNNTGFTVQLAVDCRNRFKTVHILAILDLFLCYVWSQCNISHIKIHSLPIFPSTTPNLAHDVTMVLVMVTHLIDVTFCCNVGTQFGWLYIQISWIVLVKYGLRQL